MAPHDAVAPHLHVTPGAVLAHFHPSVILGVAALGVAYAVAARVIGRTPQRRQVRFFTAAMATILIALGPIDALSDQRLFCAHMLQHILFTLVMPPLLLIGVPDWMWRAPLRNRTIRRVAKFVTFPVVAYVLYNGSLAVIHTPPVFELMVTNDRVHAMLHLVLMVTGTIMWWPLLSPLPEMPRLPYPEQSLYLFLMLIPMAAISAPITLSSSVIYPWYLQGPHPFGLSPLGDQMIGGLLMWVGSGLYLMGAFSLMFFRWSRRDDCDEPVVGRPLAATRARG